ERVVDRLEPDRDRGPLRAMRLDQRGEVDVAERAARDDEEGAGEPLLREADGACRPERLLLDGVVHLQAERLAVAEVRADCLRHEGQRHDDLGEPVLAEQVERVLHARLADDRDHRLRLVRGQRPEPGPLPSRHHHRLHSRTSPRAFKMYWVPVTTASARLIQKSASGHHVLRAVTSTRASDAYRPHVAIFPSSETSNSYPRGTTSL